jgi:hypothetical protein
MASVGFRPEGREAEEAGQCHVVGGRAQRLDAGFDADGAGGVQDEQQPREERVAAPPFLARRFLPGRPVPCAGWGCGHVLVQPGVDLIYLISTSASIPRVA